MFSQEYGRFKIFYFDIEDLPNPQYKTFQVQQNTYISIVFSLKKIDIRTVEGLVVDDYIHQIGKISQFKKPSYLDLSSFVRK